MSLSTSRSFSHDLPQHALHPLHVFLLGGATCFFLSGFLSDWFYYTSYEIQWKNFASWLILGGLIFSGFASAWALVDLTRVDGERGRRVIYFFLLVAATILGIVNELIHAKDAWASMPEGLVLSGIVAITMIMAAWLGFSTIRREGR